MPILLLLALVAFPLAEIAILIAVGRQIGVPATLAMLVLAVLGGILLIRLRGVATLLKVRGALARGEPPADALFHAACFVAAGFLLIVPGFLTDAMALALLLLLPLRRLLKAWLWHRAGSAGSSRARHGHSSLIIEGEYETVEEAPPGRPSPWRRDSGSDAAPRQPSRD
jgi:UPF0716 protein FxsA